MANCSECAKELTLYEKDEKKGWLIMRCNTCGLFFYYKKQGWPSNEFKLVKTSKLIYMTERATR